MVLFGSVAAFAGGCGNRAEEGTMVEVDQEKEEELLKAMENYYTQGEGQ